MYLLLSFETHWDVLWVPSMICLLFHHSWLSAILSRFPLWCSVVAIIWQVWTLIWLQGLRGERFVLGKVLWMFLEQVSTVRLLSRVLESLVATQISWNCQWARWMLSVWCHLWAPVLYFWCWSVWMKLVLWTDFTGWINFLLGVKGGAEPWAGDSGTPWAEVGAAIILHR